MSENQDPFSFMYDEKTCPSVVRFILYGHAVNVERYPENDWVKVAHIPKVSNDCGRCVEIFEKRQPHAFYKVFVLGQHDSNGRYRPGYEFETGSGPGVGEMVARMAAMIAEGVLVLRKTL